MRIAFLLLSGGYIKRGAEHAVHLLAEDLAQMGHDVRVYQTGPKEAKTSYRTVVIPLKKIPNSHKPRTIIGKIADRLYINQRGLLTFQFSRKLMPYLKKRNYDIIIPTDGWWQMLLIKAAKLRAKIVAIGLAGIGWTDANTLALNPDVFVALSPQAKTWATSVNAKVKVVTIPLQVDKKLFNPQVKPIKIPLPYPVVITVAALTQYKRIDTVIRAVSKLPQKPSLLILGEGEEKKTLEKLGKKLLPGRMLITSTSYRKLPRYYAAANAFTLASKDQEAFGRVLIEAQACGLPIVTTDNRTRRWIVGKKGWFINPKKTQAFALALKAAIAKNRQNHADINTNRFTRDKVAKAYENLLSSLLQ